MRIQIVIPLLLVWALVACNNNAPQKSEFDRQMDRAMELAQRFGPTTQTVAEITAAKFDGTVTPINYKSRESAERKCQTDGCMPLDLKDMARTMLVATWDSADVSLVVDSLVYLATADSIFGRHKYQTSDYGYWGNIVNLRFTEHTDTFYTEIQVKTYPMIYAADVPEIVRETIGDEYYQYIHDITGVEPGLSHVYYEIIRADTSSEATIAKYKQLSREYYSHFRSIPDPNPVD